MCQVSVQWCQYHFSEARYFNATVTRRLVGEDDATNFDVVFRGDADLGMGFDRVVAPPVFRASLHENRLVVIGRPQGWLVRG